MINLPSSFARLHTISCCRAQCAACWRQFAYEWASMHSMRLEWLLSSTMRRPPVGSIFGVCFICMLGSALHSDESIYNACGYPGVRRHCLCMMQVCAPYMHVAISGRCENQLPRRQARGWGCTGVPGLSQAATVWGLPSAVIQQEVERAENSCMPDILLQICVEHISKSCTGRCEDQLP